MTDYDGPDRRQQPGPMHDQTIQMLRLVVRQELHDAAKDGRLLSDEDRHTLHQWLERRRAAAARWDKVRTTVMGGAILVALGWIGLVLSQIGGLVWTAVKAKVQQP